MNNNNNNNHNNNNNNANHNVFILENQTSQNIRIYGIQQTQQNENPQQKYHNAINVSNSSNCQVMIPSISQRNIHTTQKPVSSVAPSFAVKSPIYQTSSTKIHPVMPQTLSLIGRGNPGTQNPNALITTSQSSQLSLNIYSSQTKIQSSTYQSQNPTTSAQNIPHLGIINSNSNNHSKQNLVQSQEVSSVSLTIIPNTEQLNEKFKQEAQMCYEQSPKHDQLIAYQTNIFDNSEKHDLASGQQEGSLKKYEQPGKSDHVSKYDHGITLKQFKHTDHQEIPFSMTFDKNMSLKHEISRKHDTSKDSQSKLDLVQFEKDQLKFEKISDKHENNIQLLERDHNIQCNVAIKLPDKPLEHDRLKAESDRNTITFDKPINEDKTKPTLPPKPIKPHSLPISTNLEKLEFSSDVDEGKTIKIAIFR